MDGEPSIADGRESAISGRKCAAARVSDTATRLFYERGIRAVGVEEIVTAAGVTKPSLYRNFSSKDDLIAACLRTRFDDLMQWWDALEARHPDDPLAQLRAIVTEVAAETLADPYRGCAITNAAVEFPEEDHPARIIARSCKAAMRERLGELVARLPVEQPDLLANGLALLFEGARASRHTSGAGGPVRDMKATAETLIAAFLPQK